MTAAGEAAARPRLLALSHLRWHALRQRPQHLMSRLARWWSVCFVEEAVSDARSWLASREAAPGVQVLVPHLRAAAAEADATQAALRRLLRPRRARPAIDVCWCFTPMAWPLIDGLDAACVVYDCMDDLASHDGAPAQVLRQRESQLLRRADLVLASGPALYDALRQRHPRAYCVPSSVDAAHFAPASLQPDSPQAASARALQQHLPAPRLGYFGVIDDRIDLGLVERIAEAHPDGSVVMVGPLARIGPAQLPRRANLHWLGSQPDAVLPHLLAGWDLALLPFARNEATRRASPAQTLEYLAGEKPVVSTAIADVIGLYGHAIEVVHGGADDFVEACGRVLHEGPRARAQRLHVTLATVATQSWDRCAATVRELLLSAGAARAPAAAAPRAAAWPPPTLAVTR